MTVTYVIEAVLSAAVIALVMFAGRTHVLDRRAQRIQAMLAARTPQEQRMACHRTTTPRSSE